MKFYNFIWILDGSSLPMDQQLCWSSQHEVFHVVRHLHLPFRCLSFAVNVCIVLLAAFCTKTENTHEQTWISLRLCSFNFGFCWGSSFRLLYVGDVLRANRVTWGQSVVCRRFKSTVWGLERVLWNVLVVFWSW